MQNCSEEVQQCIGGLIYCVFINQDPLKFDWGWHHKPGRVSCWFSIKTLRLRLKTNTDTPILTGLWLSRTRGLISSVQSGSEGAAAHREARASRATTSCAAMAGEQQAVWEQHKCQGTPPGSKSWNPRLVGPGCVTMCGRGLANTHKVLRCGLGVQYKGRPSFT